MTSEQFKYIWKTKVTANAPWYPSASNQDTAKLYRSKLSKYSKEILSRAVDKLLVDETDRLPSVGKFLEYCRWMLGEVDSPRKRVLCPCCRNTGWIFLKDMNTSTPCDCQDAPEERKISVRYGMDKKCETGECWPGGATFIHSKKFNLDGCPKGAEHYQKFNDNNFVPF